MKHYVILFCCFAVASALFENINLNNFIWLNEPEDWSISVKYNNKQLTLLENVLKVTTDNYTDFWQGTDISYKSGHLYGVDIVEDFTFTACIEANFRTRYDQAGLMIYVDEKHWLKASIEYNADGQSVGLVVRISSVNTNELSDWSTGLYPFNPLRYWLQLSKVGNIVVVKYSTDNANWFALRYAPFPLAEKYNVGLMCCTSTRGGLNVKFSDISITEPAEGLLHSV